MYRILLKHFFVQPVAYTSNPSAQKEGRGRWICGFQASQGCTMRPPLKKKDLPLSTILPCCLHGVNKCPGRCPQESNAEKESKLQAFIRPHTKAGHAPKVIIWLQSETW